MVFNVLEISGNLVRQSAGIESRARQIKRTRLSSAEKKEKGGGESEQINPPRFLRARRTRGAGMEGGNGGGIKAWGRERGRESRTLELQRGNVIIWTEVN